MAKAKSKPVKTEKSKGVTLRIKKPTIPKIKITKPKLENYKKFIRPAIIVLVVIVSFF